MPQPFRLHPNLDPANYQITDNMGALPRWKAIVLTGNSVGETGPRVGEWDHVGYVMISLDDNTIIPIARSDEHNMGWDLVHELSEKSPILQDFVPVWTGNNYIYTKAENEVATKAYQKFLSYGGHDGVVQFGVHERDGGMTSMSDFVEHGAANAQPVKGRISPLGKKIIEAFQKIDTLIIPEMKREEGGLPPRLGSIVAACNELGKLLEVVSNPYVFSYGDASRFLEEIKAHRRDTSVQWFMDAVFGFHGIKNKLHMQMKENLSIPSWAENRVKFWGDLDLAIDILARM